MSNDPYLSQTRSSLPNSLEAEKHKAVDNLSAAIGDAHDVLVRAKTVFPFTLFPDTVTVDRSKFTITHRDFFKMGEVMSIQVEDILNVTAHVGPLFGSITVTSRFFEKETPYSVGYLWRADVLRIKRILQGYVTALQQKVDCSALSTRELAKLLDELGKVPSPEKL